MSKCCCCINVRTGALILGIIGVLLAAVELVPLIPYLVEWDEFINLALFRAFKMKFLRTRVMLLCKHVL